MGRSAWLAVTAGLLAASPTRAGFYNPHKPTSPLLSETGVQALPFDQLRD